MAALRSKRKPEAIGPQNAKDGSLHRPAVLAQAGVGLDPAPGDPGFYALPVPVAVATGIVVTLVRVQLVQPAAWPPRTIVATVQRQTVPISEQVVPHPGYLVVGGVSVGQFAPLLACMDALPMQALDQSRSRPVELLPDPSILPVAQSAPVDVPRPRPRQVSPPVPGVEYELHRHPGRRPGASCPKLEEAAAADIAPFASKLLLLTASTLLVQLARSLLRRWLRSGAWRT